LTPAFSSSPRSPIPSILLLSLVLLAPASHGTLLETNLPSKFFNWNRGVHVYLPLSYAVEKKRRYPVLYLHDGQNVFSSAGTNCAFGWGSWELDKTADELSRAGKMREIIMIAVDNSFGRYEEYCGRHRAGNATNDTAFEIYTAYLLQEIKPWADANFRTLPGAKNTAVMGSSLGGVCSLALAWEHPEIFGGTASLSGAFQVEQTNFLTTVLTPFREKAKPFRVYLDSGVMDFTGGDDNHSLTEQVAAELRRNGWKKNVELFMDAPPQTPAQLEAAGLRRDKWAEAQKSQHNEFYWRLRSWRALTFLFPAQ